MAHDGDIIIRKYNTATFSRRNLYFDDVTNILRSHRGEPHTNANILRKEPRGNLALVIIDGQAVCSAGFTRIQRTSAAPQTRPNHYMINLVHTIAPFRRRGLAAKLIRYIMSITRLSLILEVDCANLAAVALYESLGFRRENTSDDSPIMRMIFRRAQRFRKI